jgi:hypothetical protein
VHVRHGQLRHDPQRKTNQQDAQPGIHVVYSPFMDRCISSQSRCIPSAHHTVLHA